MVEVTITTAIYLTVGRLESRIPTLAPTLAMSAGWLDHIYACPKKRGIQRQHKHSAFGGRQRLPMELLLRYTRCSTGTTPPAVLNLLPRGAHPRDAQHPMNSEVARLPR